MFGGILPFREEGLLLGPQLKQGLCFILSVYLFGGLRPEGHWLPGPCFGLDGAGSYQRSKRCVVEGPVAELTPHHFHLQPLAKASHVATPKKCQRKVQLSSGMG